MTNTTFHRISPQGEIICQIAHLPLIPGKYVVDVSLKEKLPDAQWVAKAQQKIQQCVVFIVLLGGHTHQAKGVLREVSIAKGLKKPRFQLRPKGERNLKNKAIPDAGKVIVWKW